MPHLTIEYTSNLPQFNANEAMLVLNQALVASGHFEEIDIKSRAVPIDAFLVGTSLDGRAFVHVKLAILSGRSVQAKQELSATLLHVLKEACAWPPDTHVQLCVEVQEIERESYAKSSISPVAP
ncbi:5-carboxymethyl-2-hydroxymuconate Delta-isomerase [Pseudoduganella ginsengisoli]|uniref:5-carboxymethyl-2-hydroxymuconate isomerase n=1 Tax=Pseudoduganella ginsengisoli TaxID=1462440 RepID=A0A6L6Q3S4_9BURK|nr:5-carboxymethyl-2-hydroxymuconate Delta-isomerase [Pseudoduganella ginsengisoli]MTW03951.1 5-carboxymethyl-2-hydroxymuconate isomerase [Pseudoduganella ginsengisoli]